MNNKKIEQSIAKTIDQAPSLNFEVLVNTPYNKMEEHDFITRPSEMKSKNHRRQLSLAFSFCFVILLCFSGWYMQYRVKDSIITLDVNPSIEIVTNRQDRILSVRALNEDAQNIIDGLGSRTKNLDSMVDVLVIAMIDQDYLNADRNVIMISVENKDIKKADALAASLENRIRESLLLQNVTPDILRQAFTKDKESSALAMQNNMSVGKMRLIQRIIAADTTQSMDTLASKSMEELLQIANEYQIDLHDIIQFEDRSSRDESKAPASSNIVTISPRPEKDNRKDTSDSNEKEDRKDALQSHGNQPKKENSQSMKDDNEHDDSQSDEDGDENKDLQSDEDSNESEDSQSDKGDIENEDSQSDSGDHEDASKIEEDKNKETSSIEDIEDNKDSQDTNHIDSSLEQEVKITDNSDSSVKNEDRDSDFEVEGNDVESSLEENEDYE